MYALIDDVLVLSRLDEPVSPDGLSDQIDLYALAKSVAERLRPLAEKHEVALSVEGNEVLIDGNESLMEQVMTNLVSNAIRYNKPGGEVVISVDAEATDAVVKIADTGVGISAEEQQKIFERFYRVDKSRSKETGGTGLGLAIVKHAVEHHHGTITLESELGQGSVFSVRFPQKR